MYLVEVGAMRLAWLLFLGDLFLELSFSSGRVWRMTKVRHLLVLDKWTGLAWCFPWTAAQRMTCGIAKLCL